MYACLSYALFAQVDRDCCVEAAMSDGSENMGYVITLYEKEGRLIDCAVVTAERKVKNAPALLAAS